MRTYYLTPAGDIGILWDKTTVNGSRCIRLRLEGGELRTYDAGVLKWCTRLGDVR